VCKREEREKEKTLFTVNLNPKLKKPLAVEGMCERERELESQRQREKERPLLTTC